MIRWLRSLFAWRIVKDTGVHLYCVNSVTGQRRVVEGDEGYQPIDHNWLETGQFSSPSPPIMPNTGREK